MAEQTAAERVRAALDAYEECMGERGSIQRSLRKVRGGCVDTAESLASLVPALLAEHEALAARLAALEGPMADLRRSLDTVPRSCITGRGIIYHAFAVLDAWDGVPEKG